MRLALSIALTLLAHTAAHAQTTIRLEGSRAAFELLAPALSEGFGARYDDVRLTWAGNGSSTAFVALIEGRADIGVSIREMNSRERELASRLGVDLKEFVVALDGLAFIVHPENDVPSLTIEQLERLFAGEVVSWVGVGGPAAAVEIFVPSEASGDQAMLQRWGLNEDAPRTTLTADDILANVAARKGALGVVSMAYVRSSVRAVPIAARPDEMPLAPGVDTVVEGRYLLRRPLTMITRGEPQGAVRQFLSYVRLHESARVLADAGLVPLHTAPSVGRNPIATRLPSAREPNVRRVSFGFRGSRLGSQARTLLEDVARLATETGDSVWITGHHEPNEGLPDGSDLSLARARSVAAFLETQGIDPEQIDADGRRTSEPIVSNGTLDGRRQNRRADVWLVPNPRD